jgi:hypothetical protein
MSVVYEWTVEGIDEHGDIIEVEHVERFEDAQALAMELDYPTTRVCLVRDSGPRLEERLWAYIENGVVPETFSDSAGEDTGVKVPKKFRA